MKASDFQLFRDFKLDPETGIASFQRSRTLLFSADSIGLLRQNLTDELGWEKAREIFLRFGYQHGFSDFLVMKTNYQFDSELDLLASGPVIHTWEGLVKAVPIEIRFDRETGDFYFTGKWMNSYEAEQYLSYNQTANEPVCWSLMGYASGWCTAFFGKPLLAIEPVCFGKGDDHCEWMIQSPDKWGKVADPYVKALRLFWQEEV